MKRLPLLEETFGVGEIFLASPRPAIQLRLRQMQRSRHSDRRLPTFGTLLSSTAPAFATLASNTAL
jgi:hypothetical protein